jgi:ribose transport system ATP-binding protein
LQPLLEMQDICKKFGATVALDRVDISINPGQVHALIGQNGAGKSTLMKILSGAIRPDRGYMYFERFTFAPKAPHAARERGVTMVYQEFSLAPDLSVAENIMLGMEPTCFGVLRKKEMRRLALTALEQLGHSELDPDLPVAALPVGLQQVVEIARAIVFGCKIIIFDEPTSSLSPQDVSKLFELIKRLKSQGYGVFYISHFVEEVKKIADVYTVLRDGKVAGKGYTSDADCDDIIRLMVGASVEKIYPKSAKAIAARKIGEVVLEIKDLEGGRKSSGINLKLHRGEILGLAGLIGSGRTELLRAVFGLDTIKSGKIKIGSYSGSATPSERWSQGVGFVSEDRTSEGIALSLSLADNLTLSNLRKMGPVGLVFPLRQSNLSQEWINRLNISCTGPGQRMDYLSGGNQQKVAIARLLHHNVDIFLLDEPTRGIDVASRAEIYRFLNEIVSHKLKSGFRPAILLVSSYLPELLGVCDRIAVMHRGILGPARLTSEVDAGELGREIIGGFS